MCYRGNKRGAIEMRRIIRLLKANLLWAWGHRVRVAVLVIVFALLAPKPLQSAFIDPCCAILAAGLTTIGNTLSSVVGGGPHSNLSLGRGLQRFAQSVVLSQNFINTPRSFVGKRRRFFNHMRGIRRMH